MTLNSLKSRRATAAKFGSIVIFAFVILTLAASEANAKVVVSKQQGFDKCFVPTVSQMQNWWNNSPYFNVNVYIGGVTRACAQSNLTANLVSSVHT